MYLFVISSAWALIPVEGILMGEANTEYQQDPLNYIFKQNYDTSQNGHNSKIKSYQDFHQFGTWLNERCSSFGDFRYASSWQDKQAKRSVVSTLQYIGLDTAIKAVGAYAKKLELSEDRYKKLSHNLVTNYCSKNITIFSRKTIERALAHYYQNPVMEVIPSIEGSPFMTEAYMANTENNRSRSREFDQLITNFRSFCSWGGDVADYRMLAPYLKNPFIMGHVIKNLLGTVMTYNPLIQVMKAERSDKTVQVACTDLICRRTSFNEFKKNFPRSVGTTGYLTDLNKLYCSHFRYQENVSGGTLPEIRTWMKAQELEDPIYETNYFISLITGVPDAGFGVSSYNDLVTIAKSSIDERWNKFAKTVLGNFSKDMLYEESLKIKPVPRRDRFAIRSDGFKVDFTITLGEMDRIMNNSEKIDLAFNLKITKNYFRWIKQRWNTHSSELDTEGLNKVKSDIVKYVNSQLKDKEKLFHQKMWNDNFADLIADELIAQVNLYNGPMFDSYQEKVILVPIRFSYGVFALSYLKYRADINANRLKLNL